MLIWIADHLPFVPDVPRDTDQIDRHEEQHVTERADRVVDRANRVTDEWNEYIRHSWRGGD